MELRRKLAYGTSAIVLIVATAWLARSGDDAGLSENRLRNDIVEDSGRSATDPGDTVGQPAKDLPSSSVSPSAKISNSGEKISLGDAFYRPASQAEVDWLNENDFPSGDQLNRVMHAQVSLNDLKAGSFSDSERLAIAEKLANAGLDRDQALSYLAKAAEGGSIYALEALGRAYQNGTYADPIKSAAYFGAAEIRGNWVLSIQAGGRPLSQTQSMHAALMSHLIVDNINKQRAISGLAALGRNPRPGLSDFLRQLSGRR